MNPPPPDRANAPGTLTPTGVVHLPDGRRTFAPGNTVTLVHGGRASVAVAADGEDIAKAIELLVAGTPAEGPSFAPARAALALRIARARRVTRWIDEERDGLPLDAEGNALPAAELEAKLLSGIESSLAALGLTPTSAAKLGVDLVRGESLVEQMQRAARERETGDGGE